MGPCRLMVIACSLWVVASSSAHPGATSDDCSHLAASFVRVTGHDSHSMPKQRVSDERLDICRTVLDRPGSTCCTPSMERHLRQAGTNDMHEIIATTTRHLKDLLIVNSERYRNEFLKLLLSANNATKSLFISTYKIPSAQIDSEIDTLFQNLRRFMQRDIENIENHVTNFFDSLFSSVYIYEINASDGTLVPHNQRLCIRNARQEVTPSPFADATQRLTLDLERSLDFARSLLDAFDLAIEVMNETDHVRFDHECSRGLTRLLYCSYCDGHVDVRPCRNFCMNVVNGCLAPVTKLDLHWNLFVDAIERLVLSMRGTFDLQVVMETVHSKISDSILRALEIQQKYHPQIVARCGSLVRLSSPDATPTSSSSSSSSAAAAAAPSSKRSAASGPRNTSDRPTMVPEVGLHRKIEMFVKNLAASRGFYHKLPDTLCSSENLPAGNYDVCWNGTSLGMYTKPVPVQDFSVQVVDNPEVRIAESSDTVMSSLVGKLDNMTKFLHSHVIPKRPLMQSDESAAEVVEQSGDDDTFGSSGNGSDEDYEESGSATDVDPEVPEVEIGRGGHKGVGEGPAEAEYTPTNTDFEFTEKSTMKPHHPPYVTKPPPDVSVTIKPASTGSTFRLTNYGSLLTTFSVMILLRHL